MSIIKLEHINKSYKEQIVLKDLNLEINEGEIVSIMGESGCGKSTILNIMGLLDKADSGNLIIQDIVNPKINSKQAMLLQRNNIGYLFQNFALIEQLTVDKNLDIALNYVKSKNKKAKKQEVLEEVGLKGFENKKVYQLSGGEQQRVALARLMLKPCNIILADEPTGSLDEKNRNIVLNLLKKLNQHGKTIVIVTHDPFIKTICSNSISL